MHKVFVSQIHPPAPLTQPAFWFVFQNEEILLQTTFNISRIPKLLDINSFNFAIQQQLYLGVYENIPCFTAQVEQTSTTSLPPDIAFQQIRQSHATLNDEDLFHIVTRARQVLHWDKNTQYCGCCGSRTQLSNKERAKECPACKILFFPQISPVMLVLIWREDEILLARSSYFLPGIYSILAGFVEPGETLERTIMREAEEEVGIKIKNLSYFGSQPWPFPSNLMLGFMAEYDSGDIRIDPQELEDAQWFSIHDLPTLPKPISLSRRMIDAYLESRKG